MKKLIGLLMLVIPLSGITQQQMIEQGISLQENGKHKEASTVFKEIISQDGNDHKTIYHLGISEFHLGDFKEAEQNFKSAISQESNVSDYYLWLGRTYKQQLQAASFFEKGILSGKALENYKKAVKVDPENVTARIALANYYIHAPSIGGGSISKAKEQVEEVKKYDPEEAVVLMAEIYTSENNYDAAIEEYKRLLEIEPGNTNACYRLGMLYQGLEQYAEAMDMFEMAVSIDTNEFASLYQVGRTSIFSGTNINRGIECMKAYLLANPGSPYPSADAAHWRLGMLYELNGNIGKALLEYETALSIKPGEKKYMDAIGQLQ